MTPGDLSVPCPPRARLFAYLNTNHRHMVRLGHPVGVSVEVDADGGGGGGEEDAD